MIMKMCGARTIALVGLVGMVVLAALPGQTRAVPAETGVKHESVLQVTHDMLPLTRKIRVARDKSMLIELPRHLRDVVISNPELVDAVVQASNRVYLIAKKVGQANAFFFDASGERIMTLEITVEIDGAPLEDLLNRLIPDGEITVEMLNETVILTGTVQRPGDATRASSIASRFIVTPDAASDSVHKQKVVNLISVLGKEQVMLKVTIAEMEREAIKRLGANWSGNAFGGQGYNFATSNAFPLTSQSGTSSFALGLFGNDPNSCLAGAVGSFGIPFPGAAATAGATCISRTLEAFERTGVLRTLAEPTLTAISGETASFLAGGEFPVPVGQSNNTISIEFKPFGVGLSFTPFVLSANRISLKINTEVSELTADGAVTINFIAIPGLKVRRASTTVEMASGASMVLAGLISEDTRQNIEGLPGLKKLPILGTLFRSRDFRKQETELVVIVTPYIVQPTARTKLARPDDNWMPASDGKANFLGHLNRIYGREEEVPNGKYEGDIGFIIE